MNLLLSLSFEPPKRLAALDESFQGEIGEGTGFEDCDAPGPLKRPLPPVAKPLLPEALDVDPALVNSPLLGAGFVPKELLPKVVPPLGVEPLPKRLPELPPLAKPPVPEAEGLLTTLDCPLVAFEFSVVADADFEGVFLSWEMPGEGDGDADPTYSVSIILT